MNNEMAYLLGMVCGNGEIQRGKVDTTIAISIPHKVIKTDDFHDIKLYVKASLENIRKNIEPLISTGIETSQSDTVTRLSFTKPKDDYLIRELGRYIGNATSYENVILHEDVFSFTKDERIMLLRGIADVTGYVRRSNQYLKSYEHRVYIEIMYNWDLAIKICNLLKSVDIPVQVLNFAHPNFRDSHLERYNKGSKDFWKKEHQIKIWVNEFMPIGFGILHKQQALVNFTNEFISQYDGKKPLAQYTHRYYWQSREIEKTRPTHPEVDSSFIPQEIRGKQFSSWKQMAKELGYGENS
ncbi:MAG: hypothetical protein FWF51_04960 [Chitinivibrionia bacterium]|nr:hypothetical protein [Chitinivibrionia bacterium]